MGWASQLLRRIDNDTVSKAFNDRAERFDDRQRRATVLAMKGPEDIGLSFLCERGKDIRAVGERPAP